MEEVEKTDAVFDPVKRLDDTNERKEALKLADTEYCNEIKDYDFLYYGAGSVDDLLAKISQFFVNNVINRFSQVDLKQTLCISSQKQVLNDVYEVFKKEFQKEQTFAFRKNVDLCSLYCELARKQVSDLAQAEQYAKNHISKELNSSALSEEISKSEKEVLWKHKNLLEMLDMKDGALCRLEAIQETTRFLEESIASRQKLERLSGAKIILPAVSMEPVDQLRSTSSLKRYLARSLED